MLDAHGDFSREAVPVAVERGLEGDPVLVHEGQALLAFGDHLVRLHAGHVHGQGLLETSTQREHLEAARIGVGGAVPVHEPGQASGLVQDVGAGAFEQVEGVGQKDLGAQLPHLLGQDGLHGRLGGHGDECGGVDVSVRSVDDAGAAVAAAIASQAFGAVGQTVQGLE